MNESLKKLGALLLVVAMGACPKPDQGVDVSIPDVLPISADAGTQDAALRDAGVQDAALRDAGVQDAALRDAGVQPSLRQEAIARIARALEDAPIEDAVVLLATREGAPLIFRKGEGSEESLYEADSAQKWVVATVLLREAQRLGLSSQSALSEFPFAPSVLAGQRGETTLAEMLSFTAGWESPPICASFPGGVFHNCASNIIESEHTVPRRFYYGTHHMMVAAKAMLPQTDHYQDLFTRFQNESELFINSSSGSDEKPLRFRTTVLDYTEFLRAHLSRTLLSDEDYTEMFTDQVGDKPIAQSPGDSLPGRWRYGFGNWVRCDDECGTQHHSAGSRGFYPWIDLSDDTLGIIAHNANGGDFVLSHDLYEEIKDDIALALGL